MKFTIKIRDSEVRPDYDSRARTFSEALIETINFNVDDFNFYGKRSPLELIQDQIDQKFLFMFSMFEKILTTEQQIEYLNSITNSFQWEFSNGNCNFK